MPQIIVNGKKYDFDADPEMPLLWVLRDLLGLMGTKYGCGLGLCGACTVIIDGEAARSCITSISSVEGKNIKTIEGLSINGNHPVQLAWKEFNVPQCGYCQPGQIMSAASLLESNSNPDEEMINETMLGNICRCGTYPRIKKAIKRAAEIKNGGK